MAQSRHFCGSVCGSPLCLLLQLPGDCPLSRVTGRRGMAQAIPRTDPSPGAPGLPRGARSCRGGAAPAGGKTIPNKTKSWRWVTGCESAPGGYTTSAAFSCTLYSLLLFTFQPMRASITVPTTL